MTLYSLIRIDGQTPTPILTLEDVKAHLRVDYTDEDTLINSLIAAAGDAIEVYLWRSLRPTAWRMTALATLSALLLPNSPILSITSVQTRTADGVLSLVDSAAYWLDADASMLRWKENAVLDAKAEALVVTYQAGFSTIPTSILQAAKLMIGHWYNHRESSTPERIKTLEECPMAVHHLLERYALRSRVSA
jgi:uncharacterized phiE125 gp8 family phage protein